MSSEIYYKRAYIKVGNQFVPLVMHGSSNCTEFVNGRECYEKNWDAQNFIDRTKLLFSAYEIINMAEEMEQYSEKSGTVWKAYGHPFAKGQARNWFINGMKTARTIEEYIEYGNSMYILDYSSAKISQWQRHYFKSTEEFLHLLDTFKDCKELSVKFENNREVYLPKSQREQKEKTEHSSFFVLENSKKQLYYKKVKNGYKYLRYYNPQAAKKFASEKEALDYKNKKYPIALSDFNPKLIDQKSCF